MTELSRLSTSELCLCAFVFLVLCQTCLAFSECSNSFSEAPELKNLGDYEEDSRDLSVLRGLEEQESSFKQRFPECGAHKSRRSAVSRLRLWPFFPPDRIWTTRKPVEVNYTIYDALPGEFPSYAAVIFRNDNRFANSYSLRRERFHQCSGVILSPDFVLSTANCLDGATLVYVKTGIDPPKEANKHEWIPASKQCLSHKYVRDNFKTSSNDIAVIKLSRPLKFDANVQSACLPNTRLSQEKPAHLVALRHRGKERGYPGTLKAVPVVKGKREKCKVEMEASICLVLDESLGHSEVYVSETPGQIMISNPNLAWPVKSAGGAPVIALEGDKHTVYALASFTDVKRRFGCSDVHAFRDEINKLIDECV